MSYVAYTKNNDGSVNILAGSSNPSVFEKILPEGTQFEVHEGDTYSANGKTWLSKEDADYLAARQEEEKRKALAELDRQFEADKNDILKYYTDALLSGDAEAQQGCQEELEELKAEYDKNYEALVSGESEG